MRNSPSSVFFHTIDGAFFLVKRITSVGGVSITLNNYLYMKYVWITLAVVVVLGLLAWFVFPETFSVMNERAEVVEEQPIPVEPDGGIGDGAEPLPEPEDEPLPPVETIGESAGGHDIVAYHFGDGKTELLFVGGVHGGYSINTAQVAFELVDYLEENPDAVPENVTVTVIPVLNPDGLEAVTGRVGRFDPDAVSASDSERVAGRFNQNDVDLNRNFDCEWQAEGTWQSQTVSGGNEPFSEPETRAIRDYVESRAIAAAVVYYSQAGGVYASSCRDGILADTRALTNRYANASGYDAFEEFDYYEITGDMVNWFAKKKIPAISVLLTSHDDSEWAKNRAGIEAVLNEFAE